MATITSEAIIEAISEMSVMEVSKLVKAMEEKFGVSASAPVAVAAAAAPGGGGATDNSEDDADKKMTVVLKASDDAKKIPVIKEVRAITGLGLKDAKDLVEKPGSTIKEDVSADEAKKIKEQLEAVGATIELK